MLIVVFVVVIVVVVVASIALANRNKSNRMPMHYTHIHAEIHMYTRVCVLQLRQLFKLLLAEAVAFIVVVPTNSYSKGRFKAGFVASVASPLHKPALLYIFFLLCSSSQRRARARARATSNE